MTLRVAWTLPEEETAIQSLLAIEDGELVDLEDDGYEVMGEITADGHDAQCQEDEGKEEEEAEVDDEVLPGNPVDDGEDSQPPFIDLPSAKKATGDEATDAALVEEQHESEPPATKTSTEKSADGPDTRSVESNESAAGSSGLDRSATFSEQLAEKKNLRRAAPFQGPSKKTYVDEHLTLDERRLHEQRVAALAVVRPV